MKVFLRLGRLRRLALGCMIAVGANVPSPAEALMPWTGEGPCSALVAAGNVAWQCDFRDYQLAAPSPTDYATLAANPGHSAGVMDIDALIEAAATCDPSPDAPAEAPAAASADAGVEPLPYDWRASSVCGPTGWSSGADMGNAPSLGRAITALGEVISHPTLTSMAWEQLKNLAADVQGLPRIGASEVATAQAGARAGTWALARSAAARVSGLLGAIGRQCLGASAALERVVRDEEPGAGSAEPTAWRTWGPQPSAEPFGHLGL